MGDLVTVGGRGYSGKAQRIVMNAMSFIWTPPRGTDWQHAIVSKSTEWVALNRNNGDMVIRHGFQRYGTDNWTDGLSHGTYRVESTQKTQWKLRKEHDGIPHKEIETRLDLAMSSQDSCVTAKFDFKSTVTLLYDLWYDVQRFMPENCFPDVWILEHLWRNCGRRIRPRMEVNFSSTNPEAPYTVHIENLMYIGKPLLRKEGGTIEWDTDNNQPNTQEKEA